MIYERNRSNWETEKKVEEEMKYKVPFSIYSQIV